MDPRTQPDMAGAWTSGTTAPGIGKVSKPGPGIPVEVPNDGSGPGVDIPGGPDIDVPAGTDAASDRHVDAAPGDQRGEVRPWLDAFLRPRVIAVVGASADPNTIAGLLFSNLLDSRFPGTVLPVNKHHLEVQGLAAYPDLASCPVVPDLVIVCVPAAAAPDLVAQAGDLGISAVCVISAGFAETGRAGAELQARLVEEAVARHVRIVGPNCTGILGGGAEARFNATFARIVPEPGGISLLSQSGAIGLAVLETAAERGLGIGGFVSVGNSVDVAGNDLLSYWGQDPETDLVLLYLESIPDPQRFIQVAREAGRRIPIVAVKAARTAAGRRGAMSHTAALSGGDAAVDALFHQAGVIRAESIEELLDLATMLSSQRRFRGRRAAVVTNGGGPGILAADACEANGLVVPELGEPTAAALRSMLPPEASVSNPVDMIASATAHDYGRAVRILGSDPEIDAVLVVYNTPLLTRPSQVATELVAARAELDGDLPVVAVFMNHEGPPSSLRVAGIASFAFPESAARALGRSVGWQERQRRPAATVRRPDVDVDGAGRLATEAAGRATAGWFAAGDAQALLDAYRIATPRTRRVRTPGEAETAQLELGCTVVVKVAAAIHKSEVGGVRLGVTTPAGAAAAMQAIRTDLDSAGLPGVADEFLVQEQIESGLEMIVGVNRDALCGPVVLVGLGGRLVEVLGDIALGIAPLTNDDLDDMLRSLKSYPLLTGYRGAPALDVEALRDLLRRVAALADDLPQIAEMDLNPVIVGESGAVAADVRIRLAGDQPAP